MAAREGGLTAARAPGARPAPVPPPAAPSAAGHAAPAGPAHARPTRGAAAAAAAVAPTCRLLRSVYRAPDGTVRTDLPRAEIAALVAPGGACAPGADGAAPAGAVWVDLDAADPQREAVLREVFRFHPLAVEDTGSPNSRVKAEEYDGYLFVIVRAVRFCEETEDPYDLETLNVCAFVGPGYVVTVHGEGAAAVNGVLAESGRAAELLARGPARVMHAVVDAVVDEYFPILDQLDVILDGFEERVLVHFDESVLRELFSVKRLVLQLRRHLAPQREVLSVLANRPLAMLPGSAPLYFRDVYDHVLRLNDAIDTYRDLMGSTLDSYLSQVNNRLGRSSKALSAVATITLPFVIVSGMWGMNFAHIPLSAAPHGFWLLLGAQCLIAVLLLAALRWRRLL